MFDFISEIIPISVIFISIVEGLIERKNIFELFKNGIFEGIKIIYKIFPIMMGLILAINIINISEIITFFVRNWQNIKVPTEIFSLIIMRNISASGSLAIVNDIFTKYGVDSIYGTFASILLGSTETAFYVILIYSSCFKEKKYDYKPLFLIGFLGNLIAIIISFLFCKKIF